MNNSAEHQKLVDDILFAVGSIPQIRCFPRHVGVGRALKSNHVIRYGVPGESDIDGVIGPHGKRLHIECKTGSGKLSKAQQDFRAMMLSRGAIYIEARSVEQVLTEIAKHV